ncbi:AcrR family transcriptional regulator [Paraburkholderia sp. GAS199]|uniref:TetR/AcrR family transcriptional regulator n=1 Tax=Paraburkholderia sp. GAS199 TaxID=3035126 RepID=UPI003D19B535
MIHDHPASIQPKASYHHGDLRSALVIAGEAVLEEQGVGGFTLAECARRAGVSKAAPAHHFGNVHGLLAAIAKKGADELVGRLEEALALVKDGPAQRVRCVARVYVDFALDRPERFRLMFGPARPSDQRGETLVASMDCALYILEREIAAVRPDISNRRAITVFTWSFVHGLAMLLLDRRLARLMEDDSADREVLISEAVQLLSF